MEMNYDVECVRGSPAQGGEDVGGRGAGSNGLAKWEFTSEMKSLSKLEERRSSMPHHAMASGKLRERVTSVDENGPSLPQVFAVKYLGKCDATGLWGIKHTRKPVDALVSEGRNMTKPGSGVTLPYLKLVVSQDGVDVVGMPQNKNPNYESGLYPIHNISYGVQDLVYPRVFAMITVQEPLMSAKQSNFSATSDGDAIHPFQCHAFVCDSRHTARQMTFSLAAAFEIFSKSVRAQEIQNRPKKFAIDLRGSEYSDKEDQDKGPEDSEV